MKKHLALTAALGLALTFTACEEKEAAKKTTEPATTTQQPSQEAAAEKVIEVVKSSFTDTRDNKTYKTVKIGTQTWMAENLNYEAKGSKCYDNKPDNCKKYGRLYDGETAKTACPKGWHLPSVTELSKLLHYVDGTSGTEIVYESETAGKYLNATSGWNENGNGTDKFGFSALPGGTGKSVISDNFTYAGDCGMWWLDTGSYLYWAQCWGNEVRYSEEEDGIYFFNSVRCIKD